MPPPQRKQDPALNLKIDDKTQAAKEAAYKDIQTIYNGFKEAAKRGTLDSLIGPDADYLKLTTRGKLNKLYQALEMSGAAEENARNSLAALKMVSDKSEYKNLPLYKRETWEAMDRLRNNELLRIAATTFTDRTVKLIEPLMNNLMSNPHQALTKVLHSKMSMDAEKLYHTKYQKYLYPEDVRTFTDNVVNSPDAINHVEFLAKWLESPGGAKLYKDVDLNPLTWTGPDAQDPTKMVPTGQRAIQTGIYGFHHKYKNQPVAGRRPGFTPGNEPVVDQDVGDIFDPLHGLTADDMGQDFMYSQPSMVNDENLRKELEYRVKLQTGIKKALGAK